MNRLKELRKQHHLTQNDIAKSINIPRTTYFRIENNVSQADYNTLIKLAQYFNVSIDYLLNISDIPSVVLTEEQLNTPKSKLILEITKQLPLLTIEQLTLIVDLIAQVKNK